MGGGDAIEFYRSHAKELGIETSTSFAGPKTGTDLVDVYTRSSVVVLPSTSDAEAFSLVLVEAMASGRPVIGTSIGGTPQVIDDGKTGLLVPPKDPKSLADAIGKIFEDPTLAQSFADAGARKAQEFSWTLKGKKYMELFSRVLAGTANTV